MICPTCESENPSTAKFCAECGAKLRAVCPQCGIEVLPTAKFCHECGTALTTPTTATAPSRAVNLEEQFSTFRQALPVSFRDQLLTQAEGENRVVTVLFADMSQSMEKTQDLHPEEGADLVNRLLRSIVDVLLKFEGRVDRFLGDGVLAVFGAPQAHESDPERAILAALEILEAARQQGLDVTAGINTGEVYVGGMGSERHQEVTVMGPVVNLAARLQGQAEPGQILVGEATYRLTQRAFDFTPVALQIKGITQPVVAYAAMRALPRPEKARGIEGLRAELIGRDEELAKLKQALGEVLQGRGQVVSLIGEAGMGKSRLVAELKLAALAAPGSRRQVPGGDEAGPPAITGPGAWSLAPGAALKALWLEGRCLELGMTASYWLFVDLFRDYFAWRDEEAGEPRFPDGEGFPPSGRRGPDPGRARGDRLARALRELVARGDLSEQRSEEMGPLLGDLLSLRFGNDWDDRLKHASPEQIKHQIFLAVHDFFVALARQRPVVLVLEDLHWADTLSLDLIALLMEALRLGPLFLVCIYRPEREHPCWHLGTIASRKCPERYTELRLRELTAVQSRRLVESLLVIENLPNAVKELILEKSHGNPFFVEEVIRSLIASGMVYRDGEGECAGAPPAGADRSARLPVWRAREGIEALAVPESIQSVILSRVDRLDRDLKRVLQSAAVIGRLFRRRLLARVTQETTELERALWELEEQEFVYQERALPEAEYSFQHVLTQETVYGNILRRRRTVFHQQVAAALETLYQEGLDEYYEQLAYHYERSEDDAKAVEYLLKAGEKAQRAYLSDEAIQYFQRALARLDAANLGKGEGWRLEALKGLGQIHHRMGIEAEAEEAFRQAIAVGKEIGLAARELARLHWWLADVVYWQNRYDETIRIGEEGLALLGEDDQSLEAALMNETIAIGHHRRSRGESDRFRELMLRNAAFIERLPYSEELRTSYSLLIYMFSWSRDNDEETWRWLRALEQRARQHHDLKALAQAHDSAASILKARGSLVEAISRQQQALELYAKIGDAKLESSSLLWLGWLSLCNGDLRQADESVQRALEAAKSLDNRQDIFDAGSSRITGYISLCLGAWQQAADAFRQATLLAREIGWPGHWPVPSVGRVYLAQGKRQEASREFVEALTRSERVSVAELSGLEEACEDAEAFRAFCRRFREEHPAAGPACLVQWFLEPAEARSFAHAQVRDAFAAPGAGVGPGVGVPTPTRPFDLAEEWAWQDPLGDCSFKMQDGLVIQAVNGRDLWDGNQSAPRLLRAASGDWAVQSACVPVSAATPTIGGILLWKDERNYLRLDRGTRGRYEISFSGCVGGEDGILGRGRHPSERVVLRLERVRGCVNALCSADGASWFTVGQVEFPIEDPVQVGLHAIGNIDRTVYPSAYPDGTAIRFESFELWGRS